jgi:hypothetical protein
MSYDPVLKYNGILDPLGKYPNPFTGRPATNLYKKLAICDTDDNGKITKIGVGVAGWSKFATWKAHSTFFHKIRNHQIMLFIAGTGVGKTVIIPKLLAHYFNYETPIICTIPKKEATTTMGIFSALLLDVPIFAVDPTDPKGQKKLKDENGNDLRTGDLFVGYATGDDKSHYDKNTTKLVFCTDGLVKNWILNDPLLSNFGGVIIDEAHERNPNIDILLSLYCNIARQRPEFRIVVMSATVNENVFIDFFKNKQKFGDKFTMMNMSGAPSQFPVEQKYGDPKNPPEKKFLVDKALESVNKIINDPNSLEGHILVFLKSGADIEKIRLAIDNNYDNYPENQKPYAAPLSSSETEFNRNVAIKKEGLDIAQQKTGKVYHRKVILSTSMAESSITFGGVLSYVIDTGLLKEPIYHPEINAISSDPLYITNAAITQRCGRTGRTSAGVCIHVYTEYYQKMLFSQYPKAAISKQDFTRTLINILSIPSIGGRLSEALLFIRNMIEPVENMREHLKRAILNLQENGMLNRVESRGSRDELLSPLGYLAGNIAVNDIENVEDIRLMVVAHHFSKNPEIREFYVSAALILSVIINSKYGFNGLFKFDQTPEIKAIIRKNQEYIPSSLLEILRTDNLLHYSGELLSTVKIIMFFNECVKRLPNFSSEEFSKKYNIKTSRIKDINDKVDELRANYKRFYKDIDKLDIFKLYGSSVVESNSLEQTGGAPADGKKDKGQYKGKQPFKGQAVKKAEPTLEEWDETPYLTKLSKLEIPKDPNFAINKVLGHLVKNKLTNGYTTPLKLNNDVVEKSDYWDNLLFILFYGYFNHLAVKSYNSKETTYYMRNSNIEAAIENNIIRTYFNKKPEFVIYNNCETKEDNFRFAPLGIVSLNKISEIPIQIINRYTEIPLYDVALKMITKK